VCPDITSRQHRIVRAFRSAAQGQGDLVLLDGWHLLHEAIRAHIPVITVAVSDPPADAADMQLLQHLSGERSGHAQVSDTQTSVVTVSASVMNALSPTRTPSGVVALVRPRRTAARELTVPAPALVILATDIQDPGNAGAIIRSAEAGGATGVWFTGVSADPWGWKALRAAMGSTFRLPVTRTDNAQQALSTLRAAGLSIVAAIPQQASVMYDVDLTRPCAVMLGGEGHGLDLELTAQADARVSVPMSGAVESLNVAAAAAVLVYEAHRQRSHATQ
jgi:TrmH family RNA methyltransferase